MILKFTYAAPPVPASRPRVTRRGTYNAPAYETYKQGLTKALFDQFGYFCWDFPAPGSKERSKWLKANRYKMVLRVYQANARGDIDNFAKSVMDAMTKAGVIADDSQVDELDAKKQVDKSCPRIELELLKV